jgi:hypothetical protein
LSSLNVSGTTRLSNNTTINGSLNVTGVITGSGSGLTNLNYNNIFNPPSSTINLNNPSTFLSTLNVSGTTRLSNNTTINGALNVTGGINGSGSGLTNLNYSSIYNPPAIPNLNNASTFISSLNVSGFTRLSNNTTINGSLNVTGGINGSGSGLTNLNFSSLYNVPTIPNFNNASTFLSTLNVSGNTILSNVTCLSTLSGTSINATQKLFFNNAIAAAPSVGVSGGNGDRMILYTGSASSHPYSIGIEGFTQWYSVPNGSIHRFYISGNSVLQVNPGALIVNSAPPNVQLGTTDGNNIGLATQNGFFSSSALANDMIIRCRFNMFFLSGVTGYAIKIPTTNIVEIPSLTAATSLKYKGTELSTTLNNYALKTGTEFSGSITVRNDTTARSLKITASSIEALSSDGTTNKLLLLGNGGGIAMGGFTGYGITEPREAIDIYNGNILIRGSSESSEAILYICNPFNLTSALKTAIIAEGIGSFSRSKLHFCLNNDADNYINASTYDSRMTIDSGGNVGIYNQEPNGYLHLGNCDVASSDPSLIFGKRTAGSTGFRSFVQRGYNDNFYFCMGDGGNTNNNVVMVEAFSMSYQCPFSTLSMGSAGTCYSTEFINLSDERIKTDIETVEDALWIVQQLRGVKYTNIQEGLKCMGLLAQEVEGIIPEVVSTNEMNNFKGINYGGLVGLLVEAIKEQQKQINDLKNILIKNNLS